MLPGMTFCSFAHILRFVSGDIVLENAGFGMIMIVWKKQQYHVISLKKTLASSFMRKKMKEKSHIFAEVLYKFDKVLYKFDKKCV